MKNRKRNTGVSERKIRLWICMLFVMACVILVGEGELSYPVLHFALLPWVVREAARDDD